jgi:hypothetical protein
MLSTPANVPMSTIVPVPDPVVPDPDPEVVEVSTEMEPVLGLPPPDGVMV